MSVTRALAILFLLIGVGGIALARICPNGNCIVPELDPGWAGTSLALLTSGVLMILSRRKK